MLSISMIIGMLAGNVISYADGGVPGGAGAEGAAQTITWNVLKNVNSAERTHLYLVGNDVDSSYQESPTANSEQGGKITYSSSDSKVGIDAQGGTLTINSADLPTNPVTITATAAAVEGYKETTSTYLLYIKQQFGLIMNDTLTITDADATGKGKISGITAEMEYSRYEPRKNTVFSPGTGEEITDLDPGVYHIRYKETDTHHHGFRSTVVQISVYGADSHNVTLIDSHLESDKKTYKTGDMVWLQPGENPGHEFVRWTISPVDTQLYNYSDGQKTDLNQSKIIFKMPDADITLTAEWKKEGNHKIKWKDKTDLFVYFEEGSSLPFGGDHPILKSPKAVSKVSGATITYAMKDNPDNGISIDPSTGKIRVNIKEFEEKNKNTPKNRITITATAHADGFDDETAEHTLTVKINEPANSATFFYFNEWFKIEQPTAPGGKGRVIALFGCSDFEYRNYNEHSNTFTDGSTVPSIKLPEYKNPLQVIELEPGRYLFRYKETATVHHAYTSAVVEIKEYIAPNTDSESSSYYDSDDSDDAADSSSSQSSSAANTSTTTTETAPVIDKKEDAVVAKVEVKAVQKGSETTSKVDSKIVKDAIKAVEKAVKEGEKTGVEIEVKTDKKTESMKVALPTEALKAVSESKAENITVKSGLSNITMDKTVLSSIVKQSEGEITLSVDRAEKKLNDKQKEAVGDSPVYDITLQSGDKRIRSFNGGRLTISIPYELKKDESAENIIVWYVDENGNIERMETVYDEATKSAVFKTPHLSKYAVMHQVWSNPFEDVKEDAWYYDSVRFVAKKNIMTGISETEFAPMNDMTRAMFVTILHRMEGAPDIDGVSKFSDVEANTYYAQAVKWACENQIVMGISPELFHPNDVISREQVAVILHRYAALKNQNTEYHELSDSEMTKFDQTSDWALNAMKWSYAKGLLKGDRAGNLNAKNSSNRAEITVIIKNFMELGNPSELSARQ